jgi:PemK-like, MazF-like toxin of type II toxin-antitoxin system
MLLGMATEWGSFRQILKTAEHLVFNEAPKLVKQLQNPQSMQRNIQQGIQQGLQKGLNQGIRLGLEALAASAVEQRAAVNRAAIPAGRPVTSQTVPTAQRARKVVYAPDLDGRADPGEIVWTWVVYEDDPTRGKDRPVLVVGRDRKTLLGLMLSSQNYHAEDPHWVGIGTGPWDYEGRPSWVRLDRVLDVPEEGIRREGAIVERTTFDVVAARLRAEFSWS